MGGMNRHFDQLNKCRYKIFWLIHSFHLYLISQCHRYLLNIKENLSEKNISLHDIFVFKFLKKSIVSSLPPN